MRYVEGRRVRTVRRPRRVRSGGDLLPRLARRHALRGRRPRGRRRSAADRTARGRRPRTRRPGPPRRWCSPTSHSDRVRIRDIAWTSPTTIVLLTPFSSGDVRGAHRCRSTGRRPTPSRSSTTVSEPLLRLAGSPPAAGETQYAVTPTGLVDLATGAVYLFFGPGAAQHRLRGLIAPSSTDRKASRAAAASGWCDGVRLRDACADLLLGGRCVGCERPGRLLCQRCRTLLPRAAVTRWPAHPPPGLAPPYSVGPHDGLLRALVIAHKEHAVVGDVRSALGALLATSSRRRSRTPGRPVPSPRAGAVPRRERAARGHDPTWADHPRGEPRPAAAWRPGRGRAAPPVARRRGRPAGLGAETSRANVVGSMACASACLSAGSPTAAPCARRRVRRRAHHRSTAREAQRALEAVGIRVLALATVAATRLRHRPCAANARFTAKVQGHRFRRAGDGLTSRHGVRPGPWLRRTGHTLQAPGEAPGQQADASRRRNGPRNPRLVGAPPSSVRGSRCGLEVSPAPSRPPHAASPSRASGEGQ